MSLPVTLNLKEKRCLIVGGGKVGVRKARLFHEHGAEVIVLSSSLADSLPEGARYINERYSPHHLAELNPWLVVAATDVTDTNQQIQRDAEAAHILVMRADDSSQGDVKGVMFRRKSGITFAVSSGSPGISRRLLETFAGEITPDIVTLSTWLKALREPSKQIVPTQAERAKLWRRVMESPILEQLQAGNIESAKATLRDIVGDELMAYLEDL